MKNQHKNGPDKKGIPAWLEKPPSTVMAPASITRAQELPLGSLAWEDFEKLCLRLVRLEPDTESCGLYGTKGQAQKGIDIYASISSSQK